MIESLELGYLWGVEAKIELLDQKNQEQILLERVQSKPYYNNDETAFTLDGQLLRIQKIADTIIPAPGQPQYPRTELGLEMDHKNGIIQSIYPGIRADSLKHAIENVYNLEIGEFLNQLNKISIPSSKQQLKRRAITILEGIKKYDFTQYLLYIVKE
ncbi:MAG: hypothetical protein V1914_04175 [archaeon]